MSELSFAKAFAPSTVANISVGFDLLGMSVPVLGDRVKITKIKKKIVVIKNITGDDGKLSNQIAQNTAGKPVASMIKHSQINWGVEIDIDKGIPLSSGLGGSAASAVAAVVAMNCLLGDRYSDKELLDFALDGEEIASGARHPDNVAPALYGGLVACLQDGTVHPLIIPNGIFCLLIYPDIEINTKDARDILKKEITHQDWLTQSSYLLGFMTGIANKNKELIFENLKDIIVTPQRKHLIPPFDDIDKVVKKYNGTELGISGAGPTMYSFFDDLNKAKLAAKNLNHFKTFVSEIAGKGAYVELQG
jgi:homoserine kinase